jgi:flavin-dependent dehydrogenase
MLEFGLMDCDVAIIGGGPAGSTLGALLRKYNPDLNVVIVEREVFPRDHVGESQLPHLMPVLAEMGAWDKVEAADFPVKVGGLYRWGSSDELWPLDFLPDAKFYDAPRPAKYAGQRLATAFQVDRSKYDKILLDHAKEVGCTVIEGVKVQAIRRDGDRILGFELVASNEFGQISIGPETELTARHFVDASGNTGMMRRAMGVETDSPTSLRNIAIWDYWQNTEWSEKIGVGGTRILVLSIGWGWIWFIPVGPTRTSLGLVTPAEYLKQSGKRPEELYMEAVATEPTIAQLVSAAHRENKLQATRDWSFVADRLYGENWFLAGDSAGFADPILSAGLTLAQSGSRKLAYTILELDRGELDADWLKQEYDRSQRAQIRNHINFADYWYSANGHFTELKQYCADIAQAAGITLDPEEAFRWMGSGGFANDILGEAVAGTFKIGAVKFNIQHMSGQAPRWEIESFNTFRLDLEGASLGNIAMYAGGSIQSIPCYTRGTHVLPNHRAYGAMISALERESELPLVMERYILEMKKRGIGGSFRTFFFNGLETLEAMVVEGWVKGDLDPSKRLLKVVLKDNAFAYGWYQEGVGLISPDPQSRGRVEVPWADYQLAVTSRL